MPEKSSKLFNGKKIKAFFRWLRIIFYRLIPPTDIENIKCLDKTLTLDSSWNTDFILCTVSACLIATFGLLSNSAAVIIGAMIVAPLMLPLRGLAFSACEGNLNLFRKALFSIIGATLLSIFLSSLIAKIVSFPDVGSEIIARTQPNLLDLGIAITAGAISGFGKVRSGISETLAGTAIAVALMPPLCVVGISFAMGNSSFAYGSFLLYLTNLLGITLACMIAFILSGYTKATKALGWTTVLTLLLIIPLGSSFFRLLQQQRIETEIKQKLVNETITVGKDVDNVRVRIEWTSLPPVINVVLQTDKYISPNQVRLVENFLNQRLNDDFEVVFSIIPIRNIRAKDIENSVIEFPLDKDNYTLPKNNNFKFFQSR
ncbi:MAG: DUF389 domain-containing protein [Cyanobacteria bacterium]|nr:DUF389 domain-containing protein [Cyanobacteria bacterium CG_2015-16_32_12]NCO79055.1 DUF389 domain-containing protein [Cyanobacteria bacterium CG_2015-22_32_23]NCQ05229.1 DUF389 domain-containing protein [Cyanobacteria bacterium CG_2015-09_32_10]NCQ40522.1 DUF389 domain-containing protein [Cyanobacteria bacterium CG_2015-04_32_10]NCS84425.1 DUF389 domain-containing protein [Cyanobacteria bacterium CG_2015-02_32_10]